MDHHSHHHFKVLKPHLSFHNKCIQNYFIVLYHFFTFYESLYIYNINGNSNHGPLVFFYALYSNHLNNFFFNLKPVFFVPNIFSS